MMCAWRRIEIAWLPAAMAIVLAACTAHAGKTTPPETPQGKGTPQKQDESDAAQDAPDRADEEAARKLLDQVSTQGRIRKQRDTFLAEHHTKTGIALFDELEFDKAKAEFEKALAYEPGNLTAKEHLRKCNTILGLRDKRFLKIITCSHETPLVEPQDEMKLALEKAESLIDDGDYDDAIDRLERVRELAKWIAPYVDKDEFESYRSRTEELIKTAQRRRKARQDRERELKRRKAEEDARARDQHSRDRSAGRLEILLEKGSVLLADARCDEARSLAENVLELDPASGRARALRDTAFAAGLAADTRTTEKHADEQARIAWLNTRKAGAPARRRCRQEK
ncbi:MAG: hypothetical protein HQ592_08290 [Planctomycetes bacterium]|nr:hypothetical protein [Planctomycetota bacterium]